MSHEKIKAAIAKEYAELEHRAIIDTLLPVRQLVLDHVVCANGFGERRPGSPGSHYVCIDGYDASFNGHELPLAAKITHSK